MTTITETGIWYQVRAQLAKDTRSFDTYEDAIAHYDSLEHATLLEMDGAKEVGEIILSK